MKYKAIIFDVSDTLVEYSPNYAQIFGDRLRGLGYVVSEEKAKEILCSKQIGMDCAWITTDECTLPNSIPYKEDYRIGKLSDLLTIL